MGAPIRLAIAFAMAVGAGLVSDAIALRGPVTGQQAVLVMALGLVLGLVGGAIARTRWVIVPLLVGIALGVELGRLGLDAPTLDLRPDNPFGLLALAVTRGVHGLLVLPAIVLGMLLGIEIVRRRAPADPDAPAKDHRRRRPPIGTAALGLVVAGLAIIVLLPRSTPPVIGADGRPVPGSIAELATVRLGGMDQTVLIRAADPDRPVLLYLSGGPGQSDLALVRVLTAGWQQDLVVAALDQRGNGTSYPAIDPLDAMTLERAVDDVIELAELLCDRFDERKVYLMGESWGTILGVLAVQERPDLFHAWIGSGQMVDVVETDRAVYADLVAYAERSGDAALAARLADVGEPPYRDIPWANANLLFWYELLYPDYTPSEGYRARGEASGLDPFGMLGSEYDAIAKTNVLRGLIDTFAVMYPRLYDLDLREDASRLEVPVWILDGGAELRGRREPMLQWFAALDAPQKHLVTFQEAAHATGFEQADEVQRLFVEVILPATYGR
jgi:pimeloyl-ACP methyl ester carboxylesterase